QRLLPGRRRGRRGPGSLVQWHDAGGQPRGPRGDRRRPRAGRRQGVPVGVARSGGEVARMELEEPGAATMAATPLTGADGSVGEDPAPTPFVLGVPMPVESDAQAE